MEYTEREREFYIGAMWATSTMWRMHTDSVAVKDMLNELPDAHDIARYCAEYDIQPLRLNVMDSLPLGCDAAYTSISYGPINSRVRLSAITAKSQRAKKTNTIRIACMR